jgi:hypothetical protein
MGGWLVGCVFGRLVGWSFGQCLSKGATDTSTKTQVRRRLYIVKFQDLLHLSITTLTQLPSLFAEDVDVRIAYDYEKVRRTDKEKEYVLPKNFMVTMETHGMSIHLDNLFNGNKFLGKWG